MYMPIAGSTCSGQFCSRATNRTKALSETGQRCHSEGVVDDCVDATAWEVTDAQLAVVKVPGAFALQFGDSIENGRK